jgi:hypothetical protein
MCHRALYIAASAGGLAFLAAQAMPGLDVAVDTAAASDLAATTAESADAAEEAAEGGETQVICMHACLPVAGCNECAIIHTPCVSGARCTITFF